MIRNTQGTSVAPLAVRVAHLVHGCHTLGPGARTVVWVRGCSRGCAGCIAGPILSEGHALELTSAELCARILATSDKGVTFSGGEPFEQAGALAPAAHALRRAGLSVMVYTGHTLAELRASDDPGVRSLLDAVDILVDGPFELQQRADLLWRGSANQRIHLLSDRSRHLAPLLDGPGVGVEIRVDTDDRLFWAGVPPRGFDAQLSRAASEHGVRLSRGAQVWA